MKRFSGDLDTRGRDGSGCRRVAVPPDQLTDGVGAGVDTPPTGLGFVVVENRSMASRKPWHGQRFATAGANLRHFASKRAKRGGAVRHLIAGGPTREADGPFAREHGRLTVMRPAERELRDGLRPLVDVGPMTVDPHAGSPTTADQFHRSQNADPRWRLDAFDRLVRRETGIQMDGDRPEGEGPASIPAPRVRSPACSGRVSMATGSRLPESTGWRCRCGRSSDATGIRSASTVSCSARCATPLVEAIACSSRTCRGTDNR